MLFENQAGVCPNCDLASSFKTAHRVADAWPTFAYDTYDGTGRPSVSLEVLECLHCHESLILLDFRDQTAGSEPDGAPKIVERRLVQPEQKPRSLPQSVPAEVRTMFEEASVCEQSGALRGAGVLYRAAAEALVKERGATGKDLYHRIDDLRSKGVTDELVDDLHEARLLGNFSIHDAVAFSAEEVADVADLIDEACVVLYVQPAERAEMRLARKVRRDAVKAKPTRN